MSITATTLSGAVGTNDAFVNVTSATGITAPNFQTASGITYLKMDQEYMLVVGVSGTVISVLRGQMGSPSQAHVINAQVQIGLPSDFPSQQVKAATLEAVSGVFGNLNFPAVFLAGATDAIPSAVPGFYVVKTAGVDAMTLAAPTAAQEGNVIYVYSDTTNAHTITATSLLANGTALKTTATFAAFRGAGLTLRASNLVWHVLASTAVTFT